MITCRFILFLLLSLGTASTYANSCQDLFSSKIELHQGDQLEVELTQYSLRGDNESWAAGTSKSLIFAGQLAKGEDVPSLFVFTDSQLNTYYFGPSTININNKPGQNFASPKNKQIPPLIRQTVGSCNMCSNVTAINALAIKAGKKPVELSGKKLEQDPDLNQFSYQGTIQRLTDTLYEKAWPEGYKEGLKPSASPSDIMKAFSEYRASLKSINTQAISKSSSKSVELAIETSSVITTKSSEFISHIKSGGSAIIGGMVNPISTQNVSNSKIGFNQTISKAELAPYPSGLRAYFRRIEKVYSSIRTSQEVYFQIFDGIRPDEESVTKLMHAMSFDVGHAVAAVGYIPTGLLKGHLIISNSWGIIEIHPPSSFKDKVNYILISK